MKKLALLLCGIGSLVALSVNAANYTTPQQEPQYQEQCVPNNCYTDTVCNQLPCATPVANTQSNQAVNNQYCAPAPCAPVVNCADTVCAPAPCNAPVPCTTPAPAQTTAQTTYNGCC